MDLPTNTQSSDEVFNSVQTLGVLKRESMAKSATVGERSKLDERHHLLSARSGRAIVPRIARVRLVSKSAIIKRRLRARITLVVICRRSPLILIGR